MSRFVSGYVADFRLLRVEMLQVAHQVEESPVEAES